MNPIPHPIQGAALIGATERLGGSSFEALNPATGERLEPLFRESGADDVRDACALAESAQEFFADLPPTLRAQFLDTIAAEVLALGDPLLERAQSETGLPLARLASERGRTVAQLAFMARLVREGELFDATLDKAMPQRVPLPQADLRRRHLAVGPVAVFGASNFPLAFSVAGGDTASAFAAGCPVIVKGHPAHPGTGEWVARAVRAAVVACGLPEGVFSYLPGAGTALGGALAADPRIKAIGFTGSRGGGLALMRIAAARPEPIPVYAEMSSINPVFLFPGAARTRGASLAQAFVASMTLGAGQFCTNPGLLIAVGGPDLDAFISSATSALGSVAAPPMLSASIASNYANGVRRLHGLDGVKVVARGRDEPGPNRCRATLSIVEAQRFLEEPRMAHEVFGASSLVVRVSSTQDFARIARSLEGQLTATLLHDAEDASAVATLLPALERRVGRIVSNGWPTGVEVVRSMVHGGPYPATSDGRSSSVGSLAIQRFLRPVCYQDLSDALLPPALQDANPWQLPRRVDGAIERS